MKSLILTAAFVACAFGIPSLVEAGGCANGVCGVNRAPVNVNVGRSFSRGAVNVNVGRGFAPAVQTQTFGPRGRLRSQTIVR
jgi:hypothetical protein